MACFKLFITEDMTPCSVDQNHVGTRENSFLLATYQMGHARRWSPSRFALEGEHGNCATGGTTVLDSITESSKVAISRW